MLKTKRLPTPSSPFPSPLFFILQLAVVLFFTSCQKDNLFTSNQNEEVEDIPDNSSNENNADIELDENVLTLYAVENGNLLKIRDNDVRNAYKADQANVQKHLDMWEFYKQIVPPSHLHFVHQFEIFKSEDNVAGYVQNLNGNNFQWKMGLSIDYAGNLDQATIRSNFTYICLHEFGHILSLNNTQIGPRVASCDTYTPFGGCSFDDAYIHENYEIGWRDIIGVYNSFDEDENDQFYSRYTNRFISSYAATSPTEDIAESFAFFVMLDNQPSNNTIAGQKINQLYNRAELIEMRDYIRSSPDLASLRVENLPKISCSHSHGSEKVIIRMDD